jgi:hypothetical protein
VPQPARRIGGDSRHRDEIFALLTDPDQGTLARDRWYACPKHWKRYMRLQKLLLLAEEFVKHS